MHTHGFLTDEELQHMHKRCAAATPGPWKSYIEGRDHTSGSSFIMTAGEDIELTGATASTTILSPIPDKICPACLQRCNAYASGLQNWGPRPACPPRTNREKKRCQAPLPSLKRARGSHSQEKEGVGRLRPWGELLYCRCVWSGLGLDGWQQSISTAL